MTEQQHTPHVFDHLQKLNRFNNQLFFFCGISHEFNNSINSIQLGTNLLTHYVQDINGLLYDEYDERLCSRDGYSEILTAMPQVIQGISDSAFMLNQFISFLSAFTNHAPYNTATRVNFNQLISHCSTVIEHRVAQYTHHFALDLAPVPADCSAHAHDVLQITLNLLMNALLALPDKSCQVTVSTSYDHAAKQITLSVQDDGMGISCDVFPRIAEPFFTTWHERGCAGIGLTVTDYIVRTHGGRLSISSESGKGTTATVSLPFDNPEIPETQHAY